jgi:type VI secretion system secreted protein VgrG
VQPAVVTGPAGEEIYPDKHGRVKVQFFWDREGKRDENSSCWIRVAEVWAGKNWGVMSTPRIGQEVVVEFLEGDPDRPLITGRVYNAEQMPPWKLPDAKAVTGLKSNSTPGGGGYNEVSLDDTKGKEKITIHGQHDMATTIEHDDTQTVHNDRTITVDGKHTETIKKDTTIKITEGNLSHDVVAGSATYHVSKKVEEHYDADQETKVGANQTQDVTGNQTETVGGNHDVSITGNDGLAVGGTQTIKVTGAIKITSDASIELTVAGSGIKIDPGGIAIKTSGKVTIEGAAKVETKGGAITTQADAIHELKGATIKLN